MAQSLPVTLAQRGLRKLQTRLEEQEKTYRSIGRKFGCVFLALAACAPSYHRRGGNLSIKSTVSRFARGEGARVAGAGAPCGGTIASQNMSPGGGSQILGGLNNLGGNIIRILILGFWHVYLALAIF